MIELSLVAKVTVVLLVSLAAVRIAAHASASFRSLIHTSAFCVLLALPAVSIALSSMAVRVPVLAAPALTTVQPAPPAQVRTAGRGIQSLSMATWARGAWLVGSLLLLFRVVSAMWRARSMRASAVSWADRDALVADLARDAGVSRSIETLLREDARTPLTIGIVRPAIVLPADAQAWAESDLRRALAHEIEHIRRNDWLVHMLARIVCALYWFHPLVWMAWRRLRLDSERACDDGVLRRADGTAYAEQLLLLARRLKSGSTVGLFMASRTDLATRIAAVIDPAQRRDRPGRLTTLAAVVAVMVVLLAIAPVQAVRASATLTGHLRDPFGGGVENMKLYLEQIEGPESYQGRTDETGHFAFSALPA